MVVDIQLGTSNCSFFSQLAICNFATIRNFMIFYICDTLLSQGDIMKDTANHRREKILEKLHKEGSVNSASLAKEFQVTMETIRKDLHQLAQDKLLIKDFGGARLAHNILEKPWQQRASDLDKKQLIAKYALQFLEGKQILLLDSGTSCLEVAHLLNDYPSMDIVTTSVTAFLALDGAHHQVFLTGGRKREKSQSVVGNWSTQFLQSISADICFLGTSGLLNHNGPTSHSYHELDVKKAMIQQSSQIYVLADSSKFQDTGFHTICDWSEITGLITDSDIPYTIYEQLIKKVPIYIVEEDNL